MSTDTTATHPSPGSVLASARVRSGLTLAEVARRSRVPIEALDALERDEWGRLPAPVYARGFLRLYAREVGVDADPLVRLMDDSRALHAIGALPTAPRRPSAQLEQVRQRRRGTAVGVALGALILVYLMSMFGHDDLPVEVGPSGNEPVPVSSP